MSDQTRGLMNLALLMADVNGTGILPAEIVAKAFQSHIAEGK